MHTLDAEPAHQRRPAGAIAGDRRAHAGIGGDFQQGFLQEPGDHAGIGAAAGHRGRSAGAGAFFREQGLAQRVVGAFGRIGLGVEIETGPGFDHGVDIEHVELAAHPHEVDRAGIDREIDAEALAPGEKAADDLAVVRRGQRDADMVDPALLENTACSSDGSITCTSRGS